MKGEISGLAQARAEFVRERFPPGGLFAGHSWRISPAPFLLEPHLVRELEGLGRVLLQFYRAINLLYRQSAAGKEVPWVADWLDRGKPSELIDLQRAPGLKNDLPRVIRPDILLTDGGFSITELDSVPGGIGLTAWLNQTYAALPGDGPVVLGGAQGMLEGFRGIFGDSPSVHIVVSDESATYRPEMEWIAAQIDPVRFKVVAPGQLQFKPGDGVYRFFELFDLANVPGAQSLFRAAVAGEVRVTPPPKPMFEEKMLFALLWNRNLRGFWRQALGEAFFARLQSRVPYTWIMDPAPLPPQAAIPEIDLTDWRQLKGFSQRERELIVKASGFSEKAWGARSVFLGSDLGHEEWSAAVDTALESFPRSPYVLQRYHHPRKVEAVWYDFERQQSVLMDGRVRLCPYYFVRGEGDSARAVLGGVLATICPADKKIIHGMSEAILAPCAASPLSESNEVRRSK